MMPQMAIPMLNQRSIGRLAPLGLLLVERPGLACAEDTTFYSRWMSALLVSEVSTPWELFAKSCRYTNRNPIFVATHIC